MKTVRIAVAAFAAAALVPLTATAALAAPPNNDHPNGARTIILGQTVKEDTSQATTGSLDAKLNEWCGAPYTSASVWYSYTPSADGSFLLDMSQSGYSGGFMVFRDIPRGRTMVGCGPESIGIRGKAGHTYLIMVFSDTATRGGNLVMSLTAAPPAPTLSVDVDSAGQILKGGRAQISGTYNCTNADYVETFGTLTQIWKRVKITGFFDYFPESPVCDGSDQTWSAVVKSDNGLFADGTAKLVYKAGACGLIQCTKVKGSATITLGKSQSSGSIVSHSQTSTTTDRGVLTWNDRR